MTERLGVSPMRAEIHGDERGVRATLVYGHAGDEIVFDCHPGDALALAVRSATPILAMASGEP